MDSRDPVFVFFEKSVIQSITLLRKWDLLVRPYFDSNYLENMELGRDTNIKT